jgi:hypothetical protein
VAETGAKKPRRIVALNGDKLGLVAGSVVATVVMAQCFFVQHVDGPTAALRVGWAFVIAYGAAFFLVRVILRTTIFEFVIQAREKKAKKRSRDKEKRSEAAGAAATAQAQ